MDDHISFKRCAIAGAWGSIVMYYNAMHLPNNFVVFIISIFILGLPWAIFIAKDKSNDGEKLETPMFFLTAFAASMLTFFCIIPFGILFWIYNSIT